VAIGAWGAPAAGARSVRTRPGSATSVSGPASQQPRISSPLSGIRRGSRPQ
jgi:hypothetical protein